MNLVRKIKISKLTDVSFTDEEKEIVDFIKSKLDDLIPFKWDKYPLSIFYMNSKGDYILEQDDKRDSLFVRWNGFWRVLHDKYSIDNTNIKVLIKYMVEQAFKEKVSTASTGKQVWYLQVEQAFNQKVSTPQFEIPSSYDLVEHAFKGNKI